MEARTILCPYCGQQIDVLVDASVRHQEYVEDCQVCCRPMTLTVGIDDEQDVQVRARTEEE